MPAKTSKQASRRAGAAKKRPVTRKKTVTKKSTAGKVAKKKASKKTAAKKAPVRKKKAIAKKKVAKRTVTAKKAPVRKKKAASGKIGKKKAASGKKRSRVRKDRTEFDDFTPYEARSGEQYMNAEQEDHFRTILLNWRRELIEEVERTVHHMQDDASNFPDPNDRATQEEEFALELRTRDRERKLIKKIDEAIGRLDSGEYGYCETCGIEIGVRRLEARPTATLCIDCKTLDEIREKQLG